MHPPDLDLPTPEGQKAELTVYWLRRGREKSCVPVRTQWASFRCGFPPAADESARPGGSHAIPGRRPPCAQLPASDPPETTQNCTSPASRDHLDDQSQTRLEVRAPVGDPTAWTACQQNWKRCTIIHAFTDNKMPALQTQSDKSLVSKQGVHINYLHRLSKKLQNYFCRNVVKFPSTVKISGTKMVKSFREVHSFSTSPNLCQRTTVLNADVPNCYITL